MLPAIYSSQNRVHHEYLVEVGRTNVLLFDPKWGNRREQRVGGLSTSGGGTVTLEQADAAMAIVDAHQHFWDPISHYYPWLNDEPPIPFRYGDYRAVRRRYLPPDYRKDAAPFRVEKSVYVEAEWNPRDPLGEMRYIEQLRGAHGLPTVAVAQAWLDHDDAPRILAQQAAVAFVRSVRRHL